jgi:ABC-type sulfate transport system permease subunit
MDGERPFRIVALPAAQQGSSSMAWCSPLLGPLFVEDSYKQYNTELAYGDALVLGGVGLVSLWLKILVERLVGGWNDTRPMT